MGSVSRIVATIYYLKSPIFNKNYEKYKETGKCDSYTDHTQATKTACERAQMYDNT